MINAITLVATGAAVGLAAGLAFLHNPAAASAIAYLGGNAGLAASVFLPIER